MNFTIFDGREMRFGQVIVAKSGNYYFKCIILRRGNRCGYCAWGNSSIPGQCLKISLLYNLLRFYNVLGVLGGGGGHISPPHI